MITPDQKELIETLLSLTTNNHIAWNKYITPTSFIYIKLDKRYILNTYKTSTNGQDYDCVSLTVIDSQGRPFENCVGCNDVTYMQDYMEIKKLYDAMKIQYLRNNKNTGARDLINELSA